MNNITINLKLQGNQFNNYDAEYYYSNYFVSMRQGFSIQENDLIMQVPAGLNKFETITFKDYFATGSLFDPEKININITVNENQYNNYYTGTLKSCLEKWGFWANGLYDSTIKRTVYNFTPDRKNYFYYGGKGKAVMYGSSSYDSYIVNLNKKSNLLISDTSSNGDSLYINAKQSDVRAFFNVDKYGRVDVRGDGASDDLFIFNKKSLTAKNVINAINHKGSGYIEIDKFFENSSAPYTKSTGYIEYIHIGKNITDLAANSWEEGWYDIYENRFETGATVESIAENVVAWLSKHTKYNDAFDVLYSGNTKDINSLLKCYTSEKIWLNKNLI